VSISGYHIREAGSTAGQELAFTIRDGVEYVEWCLRRGLDVDAFAPRLSFFFNSHNDFLEEIAKFRAARRLWARLMRERFGAKSDRSCWCRFHVQTAGCSLYGKQVHNNIIRTAYQALAGVLGGCQSLHTNSMDETLALPTEHAVTVALRTQQVLAFETGVTGTVDPLGGSHAIEALTNELEAEALDYIRRIDEMGGMIPAIENGFVRREIAEAAFRYAQAVEQKRKIVVGVNDYLEDDGPPVEILKIDHDVETQAAASVRALRARRDAAAWQRALKRVTDDAQAGRNVMPSLIDAAKAYATLGECVEALARAYGRFDGGPLW
jgi:methylmalonyl-CoA mutase N-terminal domain/subunit